MGATGQMINVEKFGEPEVVFLFRHVKVVTIVTIVTTVKIVTNVDIQP